MTLKESEGYDMDYKEFLIKLLDSLSEKSIRRLYNLAEYLYIYADEKGGAA